MAVAATAAQAMRTEIVVSGRMPEYATAESQSARLSSLVRHIARFGGVSDPAYRRERVSCLGRRPAVVDFNHANARAVVSSRQQRRVRAGR